MSEPRVPRPAGASRYGWFVGVVMVLAVVYVTLNGIRTESPGARGLDPGEGLPPFAVPLVLSDLEGDANVATGAGQGEAGGRPACGVRGPEILNICQLAERGPVVLAFLATRGGDCANTIDSLRGIAGRHPGVQVAVVAIRGDRGELRDLVRSRGWDFPVGHDRDGVLANFYGVSVCPQITYARWRGRAQSTSFGKIGARELDRRVEQAVAASRRTGWERPR
ncbi:MAG: hypothetical protein H0T43_13120 [Solirubrobacterales bacterium]|nr:hypothetical protein [Solirubrobacterales bacterium]